MRDNRDGSFNLVPQLFAHGEPNGLRQIILLGLVIIFSMEGGEVETIERPEPSFLKDLFQLVEKEVGHKYSIIKGMFFRTFPLMTHLAKIEGAFH